MDKKQIIVCVIVTVLFILAILAMVASTNKVKKLCASNGYVYLGNGEGGWSYCGAEDERGIIVEKYRIRNGRLEVYEND